MKEYTRPSDVHSPRRSWALISVLDEGEEGSMAVAIGRWDNTPVIALRWNGNSDNPIGNPQSRGLPTWFILELGKYTDAIIDKLPPDKKTLVKSFITGM